MLIGTLKKYLFGLVVAAYLVTVIGIPVYLHYCGGELETVSYLSRNTSCCGEEEDTQTTDDGCCKDEQFVLKSSVDFTLSAFQKIDFTKSVCDLFYSANFYNSSDQNFHPTETILYSEFPPPKRQQALLVSVSVMRI